MDEQLGFELGERAGEPVYFKPEEIREDAAALLAAARAVTVDNLWDERTLRYNRVVFPNLIKWLPEEEAAQLCFQFIQEVGRIELLMAA